MRGRFRDECLNEHRFLTMAHARRVIEQWRIEYNSERPHSSLGDLTPEQFAMNSPELLPPDLVPVLLGSLELD
jgi:putative transposase